MWRFDGVNCRVIFLGTNSWEKVKGKHGWKSKTTFGG